MRVLAPVLVAVLAATTLSAQAPGSRMRVGTADGRTQLGQLVSLRADSVRVVDAAGIEHGYARGELRSLEVSIGQRSNFGRGIARGAIIGGGAGLLLGVLASTEEGGWGSPCDGSDCIPLAAGMGLASGVAIGGVVGAVTKHDEWKTVERAAVEPEVRPVARGVSVGVRVRF